MVVWTYGMNEIKSITEIFHNAYLVKFSSQYAITSTLMRLQEFYESPTKLKNHYFNLEEFMDDYAKKHGNFSYCEDWGGFNIPDFAIRKFESIFAGALIKKEQAFINLLANTIDGYYAGDKFYLIAVSEDEYIDHELAHAFYYLIPKYKKAMNLETRAYGDLKALHIALLSKGYSYANFFDEVQAYLATSNKREIKSLLGYEWKQPPIEHRQIFKRYKKDVLF